MGAPSAGVQRVLRGHGAKLQLPLDVVNDAGTEGGIEGDADPGNARLQGPGQLDQAVRGLQRDPQLSGHLMPYALIPCIGQPARQPPHLGARQGPAAQSDSSFSTMPVQAPGGHRSPASPRAKAASRGSRPPGSPAPGPDCSPTPRPGTVGCATRNHAPFEVMRFSLKLLEFCFCYRRLAATEMLF
jgi:hypothetical protein